MQNHRANSRILKGQDNVNDHFKCVRESSKTRTGQFFPCRNGETHTAHPKRSSFAETRICRAGKKFQSGHWDRLERRKASCGSVKRIAGEVYEMNGAMERGVGEDHRGKQCMAKTDEITTQQGLPLIFVVLAIIDFILIAATLWLFLN